MDAIRVKDLYDLSHTRAADMLSACEYPWEALAKIKETVLSIGSTLDPQIYDQPSEGVWIAKSASVAPTASISAPCIVGENTEVRPGAFLPPLPSRRPSASPPPPHPCDIPSASSPAPPQPPRAACGNFTKAHRLFDKI